MHTDPTTLDTIARCEDASRAINSALDRLHSLAVIIREISAKRVEYTVSTFLTDDDTVFRRDAASLVQWRFQAAGKGICQQLGDSIAVRRKILLMKNLHAKELTVRRVTESGPSTKHCQNLQLESEPTATPPAEARIVRRLNSQSSSLTNTAVPDQQEPVLKGIYAPRQQCSAQPPLRE